MEAKYVQETEASVGKDLQTVIATVNVGHPLSGKIYLVSATTQEEHKWYTGTTRFTRLIHFKDFLASNAISPVDFILY